MRLQRYAPSELCQRQNTNDTCSTVSHRLGCSNERPSWALALMLYQVVYNARKRGADRASDYFKRTENIAGVKDMRFQALMPDILHWLGIKKIDRMLSMSK